VVFVALRQTRGPDVAACGCEWSSVRAVGRQRRAARLAAPGYLIEEVAGEPLSDVGSAAAESAGRGLVGEDGRALRTGRSAGVARIHRRPSSRAGGVGRRCVRTGSLRRVRHAQRPIGELRRASRGSRSSCTEIRSLLEVRVHLFPEEARGEDERQPRLALAIVEPAGASAAVSARGWNRVAGEPAVRVIREPTGELVDLSSISDRVFNY